MSELVTIIVTGILAIAAILICGAVLLRHDR